MSPAPNPPRRMPAGATAALAERPPTCASGSRRLASPRPAPVVADAEGRPAAYGATSVAAIREEWVVEDRWWTGRPLRRRYFELVLGDGRNVCAFHDVVADRWFAQRA